MKKGIFFVFIYIFLIFLTFPANNDKNEKLFLKTMGNISISAISSALSKADIALCKSVIYPPHLKGDYGETIVEKIYLEQHLKKSGNWQSISARFGRQGIDQIYIKYDKYGTPRDIMVGEVKYGSSRIGITKDGIQLGNQWTKNRLIALGNRYLEASEAKITIQNRPSKLSPKHQIEIDLGNGKKGIFWRKNSNDPWKYEGTSEDLPLAKKKLRETGKFIKEAGEGVIKVRKRIFEVKIEKEALIITIKNGEYLDAGISQAKIKGKTILIRLNHKTGKLSEKALIEEIAKQLKKKMPHFSDEECYNYAEKIADKNIEKLRIDKNLFHKSVIINSLKTGLVSATFSLIFEGGYQLFTGKFNGEILLKNTVLGFMSGTVGAYVGQMTISSILESKLMYSTLMKTAASIGIKLPTLINITGGVSGGAIASLVYAGGGYLLGLHNWETTKAIIESGVIFTTTSIVGMQATMYLVSMYGVAGTGVAISSLSGAAATNAVLAWLGGGSLAAGGGGIALGTAALGVVGIAAGVLGTYLYSLYKNWSYEKKQNEVFTKLLQDYKKGKIFEYQTKNLFPYFK